MHDSKQSPLSDPKRAKPVITTGAGVGAASPSNLPSSEELTLDEGSAASSGLRVAVSGSEALPGLPPGAIIAGRYQVLQVLGAGGMGTVYKAKDRELDRIVALKTIRPELAGNPPVIQRFKQELILARQVTHRNVVRIYDLGESEGLKFITMEYVDGEPLTVVLQRRGGKLPPKEAADIIEKVCLALEAAHAEGVIHRDLKPGNIMRDAQHRIVVMDFGVAHLADAAEIRPPRPPSGDPSTTPAQPFYSQTGVLVGTPAYMAPEQALGEETDARSDIFAVGIIFFELLTGQMPFQADTPEMLLKRTREKAKAVHEIDPKVPRSLSKIVERCLEPQRDLRYQTATELLTDLDAWLAPTLRKAAKWIAAAAAVLLLAGTQIVVQWVTHKTAAQHAPVSVLVADFKNDTGEGVFDGTLEPAFGTALEGAPFITGYSRAQAHKVAAQLQPGATILNEPLARLVATRENVHVVVTGSISHKADAYDIQVKAIDPTSGKSLVTAKDTTNKQDVLLAVGKLAARIRKALGDRTPESAQAVAAESFTARSLEAAHEYAVAQTADLGGKWDAAIEHALKALQFDPELGRAYVVLGVSYHNTGRPQEAEKNFRLALAKIDSMSDREKYRTRGAYYLMMRNPDKALEQFTQLVKQYPSDSAGLANLALAYFYRRDMVHALEEGRRAVEIYPNNVAQRNNVGLYAMYAGDFASGIQEQQKVLELNPSFVLGYVGMALSQLGEGHPAQAVDTYQRLQKLGAQPASTAAAGFADVALYKGRVSDAVKILTQGAKDDLANKNPDSAASKLAVLAQAYLLIGDDAAARDAADQGLQQSKETGIMFWAARAYLGAKKPQKALALAQQLANRLEADPQAYAKLIEAEYALSRGKAREALQLIADSRRIADTWTGRYDAALAYLNAGAYAEADTELEVCLKRRGEATALFLDELPTYHLFPPVYYYLGRAQEGLKSPAASDSYKNFLSFKDKADHDPLVADARRRLASL